MIYELFLDEYFAVNLVMDYYLLRLVCRVFGRKHCRLSCLLGSLIGAAGICTAVLLQAGRPFVRAIYMHVLLSVAMVRIGCKIRKPGKLLLGVLTLYATTFVCGGLWQLLFRYTGYTFLTLSVSTYLFLHGIVWLCERIKKKDAHHCTVTFRAGDIYQEAEALFDTGNCLIDPLSQKPVSIVEKKLLEKLYPGKPVELLAELKPHYIAFHSLGKEEGVILAVTLDEMEWGRPGENMRIEKPVVAVTGERLSADQSYQVILNAALLEEDAT